MKSSHTAPRLLVALAILWAIGSWYWYVCAIKGFCRVEEKAPIADAITLPSVATDTPVQDITPAPQEAVHTPACDPYLHSFIKLGQRNDPSEVRKLETFLNTFEGNVLPVNGVYERQDYLAVRRFQWKYRSEIMTPWHEVTPTGFVYTTTIAKINALYCARPRP